MTVGRVAERHHAVALDDVLSRGLVRPVFQPLVDLRSHEVVGFEALARGVPGSPLESPAQLFAAARREDRLAELDWLCIRKALESAAGRLGAQHWLFVNVEPEAVGEPPSEARALIDRLPRDLRVMVELTERSLTDRPAELLALVRRVRQRGWGVALDDVGADPRSLALMPLLQPDVIKLDLSLVQKQPDSTVAEIVAAVSAYAERSGAVVLAEGIETDDHAQLALAMGARYGQGWRFARPGPLPDSVPAPADPLALTSPSDAPAPSPFRAVAEGLPQLLRSTKPLLIQVSKHLEQQALALGPTAVVLAAFQHRDHFTPRTTARYVELARRAALVGALGADMPTDPAPGVRGAQLGPDDPIRKEWDIAVISPHFAAALVARDLGDTGPEERRRFDYVLTYDRDRVTAVAHALLERFITEPGAPAKPLT